MDQITVHQLAQWLQDPERDLILLDVRLPWELRFARIEDPRVLHLPMQALPAKAEATLPTPTAEHPPIYVICHHGLRSATVVRWLKAQGWPNCYNVQGGLERYAQRIDPDVGR